jgi:adenylate cyclase
MQQILDGAIRPETGDHTFICALFSDVRGYTTMSEQMTPPQVLALFNRYFDRMVDVVHRHGGAVISFMGDGMMAIFGAPQPLENPCVAAMAAGLEMLDRLAELNEELAREGLPPIAIGVGIHAGDAVVGHVGSRTRHDYTAIGDAINVAARLESATKEAGFHLVCSTQVVERLPDRTGLTALGPMSLKGHTPVDAWGAVPATRPDSVSAHPARAAVAAR